MTIVEAFTEKFGSPRLKENEPLAKYTTLKVGGGAQYFFVAFTTDEIAKAYTIAKKHKLPVTILGGGTNVVISDRGIPGLVIKSEARSIKIVKQIGSMKSGSLQVEKVLVEVSSGVLINQLVRFCCDEGLSGLEYHLGLPGTVGGALYMNSKWTKPISYVGDALYQAKILGSNGEVKIVDQKYFNFGYDQSNLQKTHDIVLTVTFLLTKEDPKLLWERANSSISYRKETQPMGVASAGCTFRNISTADAFRLATPNNTTSAGFLVDQVGLKNFRIGKTKFSDKHANFILNTGGGKAAEVKELIDEARKRVRDRFQVEIEPEIVLLGSFN